MDRATSLVKALDILTLLGGRRDGHTIPELALAMNAPRSTVVRILNTLIEYGLVQKADGRCVATPQFFQWATPDRNAEFKRTYRPVLERVARDTGELVLLGVLSGKGIIHIDFVESDHAVRVAPAPHTHHNIRTNALGKLALSRRPDLAEEWTHRDRVFARELSEIRRTGIAWNRGESVRGMVAMAVPGLSNHPTEPMIAVAWPAFRFTEQAAALARKSIFRALK